jgi:hypothetical protein
MDCRELNKELMSLHFQMEDLNQLKEILEKNMFTTAIDIKQAFHHIPVIGELKDYLCFMF